MASTTVGSLEQNPAAELAAIRVGVHGLFLAVVWHDSFSALAVMPTTLMRLPGIMQYVGWRFLDRLLTSEGMFVFKLALLISLLMGTLGWWTWATTKSSALLMVLYEGLLQSYGGASQNEMAAVTVLILLAFLPCGDTFSVDAIAGPPVARPRSAYRYPVALARVLVAWVYVSNGLLILRFSGWRFFDADNLPAQFVAASLGNLNETHFRVAFSLIPYRHYVPPLLAAVVAWAILFPLGYFWKRTRHLFLAMGVLVHIGVALLFNKIYFVQMAMFLVFFDWVAIGSRVRHFPGIAVAVDWWERFSAPPEFFPGVRTEIPAESGGELRLDGTGNILLWDGDCGFCRRMVGVLERIALRPVAVRPFQEMLPQIPAEVLPWTSRQMHWVRADGSICGGSQAMIEVLEAGYHNLTAGALECPVMRPFTWLAYRIVAGNRGLAGEVIGASCEVRK
jgi:predicted DCC family thiol-disulfide oxidoreductase YuxK